MMANMTPVLQPSQCHTPPSLVESKSPPPPKRNPSSGPVCRSLLIRRAENSGTGDCPPAGDLFEVSPLKLKVCFLLD